jgi:hypothetical protein
VSDQSGPDPLHQAQRRALLRGHLEGEKAARRVGESALRRLADPAEIEPLAFDAEAELRARQAFAANALDEMTRARGGAA